MIKIYTSLKYNFSTYVNYQVVFLQQFRAPQSPVPKMRWPILRIPCNHLSQDNDPSNECVLDSLNEILQQKTNMVLEKRGKKYFETLFFLPYIIVIITRMEFFARNAQRGQSQYLILIGRHVILTQLDDTQHSIWISSA